jgi:ATPase family associated with various cellular activities (AAA)
MDDIKQALLSKAKSDADLDVLCKLDGCNDDELVRMREMMIGSADLDTLRAGIAAADDREWTRKERENLVGFRWEEYELFEPVLAAVHDEFDWQVVCNALYQADGLGVFRQEKKRTAHMCQKWREELLDKLQDRKGLDADFVRAILEKTQTQRNWLLIVKLVEELSGGSKGLKTADFRIGRDQPETRYLKDRENFDYLPATIKREMPEHIKALVDLDDRFDRIKSKEDLKPGWDLIEHYPNCANVISSLLGSIEQSWGMGNDIIRFQPTILVGEAGLGKTKILRELCNKLLLPVKEASVGGARDANLFGVSAGWGTALPGIVTEAVAEAKSLNPMIIINEIEKAEDTRNGAIHSELLALLEPSEAANYRDRYLATNVDASHVNWVFTANSLEGIPVPLKSRCNVLEIRAPEVAEIPAILKSMVCDYAHENGLRPEFFALTTGEVEEFTAVFSQAKNVRALGRALRRYLSVKFNTLAG